MSLQGLGGASNYWYALTPLAQIGSRASWSCCWTAGSSTSQSGLVGFAASPSGSNHFQGPFDSAGKFAAISIGNVTGQATEAVASVASDGSWQHVLHAEYSSASREVFVNGVSKATNTTTLTQTLDRVLVGLVNTSNPLITTRWVAEAVFGWGVLSAAQIKALAQGQNPLTLGLDLIAYFPLRGDLNDLGPRRIALRNNIAATEVWRNHPPVARRPRRPLSPGTTISSSVGTATGAATVSGVGSATANAAGTASGAAAVSAVGAGIGASAGTATGSAAVTATGASLAAATGTVAGSSDVQGVGQAPGVATGTVTGDSTVVGIGAALAQAVATAVGAGDAAGVAAAFGIATGAASGASAALGITASIAASVGTATGSATVVGMGQVPVAATGTAAGNSAVSGVGFAFNPAWSAAGTLTGGSSVTGAARSIAKGIGRAAGQSTAIAFSGSIERRKAVATLPADTRATRLPHDSRTAIARGAMTNLEFPRPKDPADSGLYAIHSPEPITSVERVAVSAIGPTATQGVWRTPGDAITGSPLTASGWTVSGDGMGIEFRLQGGAPGIAYAIRAAFTTASGSFVNRSAVLRVTGL